MTAEADVPPQHSEGFQRVAPPGHRQAPVALTGAPLADIAVGQPTPPPSAMATGS